MSTERQAMQDYLDALVNRADFPAYFTDDVVATFEGTDQRADGREAAGQLIRYVHQGAFDARTELKNLLIDQGKAATEADLQAYCKERMADFKVPKKIHLVTEIPRTATGKVQRRVVAAALAGSRG